MRNTSRMVALSLAIPVLFAALASSSFAQGGGGGGGAGAGSAAGASAGASGVAGSTGGMSGAAGTGNTSTGVGASTGASSTNTVGQVNAGQAENPISPANPSTTQPGGANALPVPNGTVTQQNAERFDPRLSPGYQK
jgi:hypothetical protein